MGRVEAAQAVADQAERAEQAALLEEEEAAQQQAELAAAEAQEAARLQAIQSGMDQAEASAREWLFFALVLGLFLSNNASSVNLVFRSERSTLTV